MDTSQGQNKNDLNSEKSTTQNASFAEERANSTSLEPSTPSTSPALTVAEIEGGGKAKLLETRWFDKPAPKVTGIDAAHDVNPRAGVTDNQVLLDRGGPHGPVDAQFGMAQRIKNLFRTGSSWDPVDYKSPALTPVQKECLEMLAVKLSRILEGDPRHLDHWVDLQGYPELVVLRMQGKEI